MIYFIIMIVLNCILIIFILMETMKYIIYIYHFSSLKNIGQNWSLNTLNVMIRRESYIFVFVSIFILINNKSTILTLYEK